MRLPSRLDRPKDTRSLTAEALARASFGVLPSTVDARSAPSSSVWREEVAAGPKVADGNG